MSHYQFQSLSSIEFGTHFAWLGVRTSINHAFRYPFKCFGRYKGMYYGNGSATMILLLFFFCVCVEERKLIIVLVPAEFFIPALGVSLLSSEDDSWTVDILGLRAVLAKRWLTNITHHVCNLGNVVRVPPSRSYNPCSTVCDHFWSSPQTSNEAWCE